ncbi:unnamed protein product [Rotaria sp. Silwood2]|nr:unnamed protein product [Rotaria sp. Silwood2]
MIRQLQLMLCILCFSHNQYVVQATIYSCNTAAPCGCSKTPVNINARIFGGEIAASHSWGWSVSLRKSDIGHFCGGSILSPSYVLTAATCVYKINLTTTELTVVVGTDNLDDNIGQRSAVSEIYVHPKWNQQWHPTWNSTKFENDIAILKLKEAISFDDDNIAKLCLPSSYDTIETDFPLINSQLVAVGWGETELDPCQGDSGGPLMYYSDIYKQWMIAGITSFLTACETSAFASVYTRVTMYIDWIKSVVGNDNVVIAGENTATFSTIPTTLAMSTTSTMSNMSNMSVIPTLSTMFCIATLLFIYIMRSF